MYIKVFLNKMTLILAIIFTSCKVSTSPSPAIIDQVQGFNMPVVKEPVIPDNTAYITDFGAVNDGQTLNTKAIADAVLDGVERASAKKAEVK